MCFCWHCWHCLVGTACFLDLTSQLFAHAICFIGHTSAFWVNYMKLTDSIYTIFLIRTPFSAKRWCSYFARDLCLITLVTPNVRCIPRHRDTRTVARFGGAIACACVWACACVSESVSVYVPSPHPPLTIPYPYPSAEVENTRFPIRTNGRTHPHIEMHEYIQKATSTISSTNRSKLLSDT